MSEGGNTRFWAGAKGTQQTWSPAPLAACPTCRQPTSGQPFCGADGTLTASGPFAIGERYVVEETLGAGGMAFVFGAHHQVLGKPVALKVLRREMAADPAQAQRFLREARLASQLHHENIVNILDFGRDDDRDLNYLVMERLVGRTLSDVMDASAPMPWRRAVPILIQLARALEAAHAGGVSHRDLTPRNVMLVETSGRSDVVKLCDFGLSRLAGHADRVTSTGTFLGTPAYAAPEQIRGDANQDHRVDLYALAVIAYEMCTGKLPHEAPTSVALIAAKLTADPIAPSARVPGLELPSGLENWLLQCLQRDPAQRHASAAETARILAALLVSPQAERARGAEDLIGQTIGSYRVLSKLGSGGAGSVYLAEHPVIRSRVAIKVLQPEVLGVLDIVERFIEEARASSQLGSPHIARCQDFGFLPGGQPFAVMEYLEGETVGARLVREGRLSIKSAAEIGQQVAKALDQAHAAGIIHRDIKPENLMVVRAPDGADLVKVLDFGIAKLRGPAGTAHKTTHGFVLGTPYYCSPEQMLGEEVGPTADVYALGATLFELLTGQPPFEGSISEIAAAKLSKDAPLATVLRSELPSRVGRDLASMLSREPNGRPTTMRDVEQLLAQWSAENPPADDTEMNRGTRARWFAACAAVVVVIVAAIVIAMHGASPTTKREAQPSSAVAPAPAASASPPPAAVPPAPTQPAAEIPATSNASAVTETPTAPTTPAASAPAHVVQHGATTTKTNRPSAPKGTTVSGGIVDPFPDETAAPPKKQNTKAPLIVNPFDQ